MNLRNSGLAHAREAAPRLRAPTISTALSGFSAALAMLVVSACSGSSAFEPLPSRVPAAQTVAFVNASVLPMDGSVPLVRDQTVLVRDGLIVAVGTANQVTTPPDAVVIDARGRFLMPGMIDAHTHIRFARDLTLYAAYGVTTVITLGQSPTAEAMQARGSIARGESVGSRVFAAIFLDGPGGIQNVIPDTAGVRAAVRNARQTGHEIVKAYNRLTADQFAVAVDEARNQNMPVIGHAVRSVPLEFAIKNGQHVVAHAEEYLYSFFRDQQNDARIPEAARFSKAAGVYVIPNLSAYTLIAEQWGNPSWLNRFDQQPEFQRLHPGWQSAWRNSSYVQRAGSLGTAPQFLARLTRALADSGVALMTGTDSPVIPGLYPGESLAYDMETMVAAGISPLMALQAATRNGGNWLQQMQLVNEPLGRIVAGTRADLLLLDRNPLDQVGNVRSVAGVMLNGAWYAAQALDSLLQSP